MIGELYAYKGEFLTQAAIAKKEGINRATLADWYKKTQNMEEAVAGAKKSLAQRNIDYYGQIMSLKAIAEKENLKFESLKREYDETHDIYLAVNLAKEAQLKRNGSILYKGKMMTILAIAELENIGNKPLGKHFEETGDIYKAVELTKEAQEKQRGTILYKGKLMTLTGIATLEHIKKETLKEFYELYNDIDKAVFITKQSQIKRKQALLRGKQATYEELANYFGLSSIEIDRMINNGLTPEDIEKKVKKGTKKDSIIQFDDNSLYKYCLEHSYNYWVINYLITAYNKTPEEAINEYLKNGQSIPISWIYEKYDLLFKHLMLNFGIDSNRIVKIMKDNNYSIDKAIEEYVFISNNESSNLKQVEIYWLKELYSFLKGLSSEDLEAAKEVFFISERELEFLEKKDKIIENINRQLLLFEFSTVLNEWPIDELKEMMELYGITEEEKISIVCDLYNPFESGLINPKEDYLERRLYISGIVKNTDISDEEVSNIADLSELEKKIVIEKRKILKELIGSFGLSVI